MVKIDNTSHPAASFGLLSNMLELSVNDWCEMGGKQHVVCFCMGDNSIKLVLLPLSIGVYSKRKGFSGKEWILSLKSRCPFYRYTVCSMKVNRKSQKLSSFEKNAGKCTIYIPFTIDGLLYEKQRQNYTGLFIYLCCFMGVLCLSTKISLNLLK